MNASEGTTEKRAERLAHARKKLRDYQSKHRNENVELTLSPSPSVSSMIENSGRRSVLSLRSQDSPSTVVQSAVNHISDTNSSAQNSDFKDKFQQDGTPELYSNIPEDLLDLKQECVRLREELALRTAEKGQFSSQFAELAGHYSQIHAAYTKLSECIKNGDPGGSTLQTQLVHLQTAMSVVVKEKTTLHQQLRQRNELVMDRNKQICSLTTEMNEKTSYITSLKNEIVSLRKKIDSLSNTLQRQMEEAENNRQEAINWQTKMLHMQQDRDDAKERLKICMRKAEAAQAELDEAHKQLRMKNIYLRQLGAYAGEDIHMEGDVKNLGDEIEQMKTELVKATNETEKWKREAQLARERYELYGTQLNQNIVQMSTKLEEMSNVKLVLESKVLTLENQIEMMQAVDRPDLADDNSRSSINSIELQRMQNKLTEAMNNHQRAEQLVEELNAKLMNKELEVHSLSSALDDEKSKLIKKTAELAMVEESLSRVRSIAEDQQKHTENEKATVSRAIAQNRELKEQLTELQDKLVMVTQESMERESGRLSALHLVDQLRNELNRLSGHSFDGKNIESSTASIMPNGDAYEHQQHIHYVDSRDRDETISTPSVSECYDRDMSFSHAEDTHAHTEVELANVRMVLDELRLDHRRVMQENEELRRIMEQNSEDENQNNIHVELGQAVERINALSVENEQLRNDVSMLQEKINSASLSTSSSRSSSQCDMTSPVWLNSDVVKHLEAPSIKEKPLAWTELEARFTRAMLQVADLAEEKERLQHIVMQLETENDTIGDYVTLYQHQRKKINERMREREEAVAKLSFEKEQTQQKLNELQKVLMNLLSRKRLLHINGYEKKTLGNCNGSSKCSRSVRPYSQSTKDKFSDNEETVVDGSELLVPSSPNSCIDVSCEFDSGKYDDDTLRNKVKENLEANADDDVGVQRILNLISELQDLERTRTLAPCSPNLHCSECRGKLINL
ncbi:putative golgin subfamily A member 2-like protein 5 protein [Brugia pahangi]